MIRAGARQRSAPYVCAACRQKLSSSRFPSLRPSWTARHLSTTAPLCNPKDDTKPKAPLGVFGAGVGSKFGAFAKKAPASSPSDGLLPHERLARQQAPVAPPPPPPARQTRSREPKKGDRRNKTNSDGVGSVQNGDAEQRAIPKGRRDPKAGLAGSERAKSLSSLFNSERKPMPPQTPASWATGQDPAPRPDIKQALQTPKRGLIDRSKPHWGQFRDRKAETVVSKPKNASKLKAGAPTSKATTTAKADDQQSTLTTDNFWDAFEARVHTSEGEASTLKSGKHQQSRKNQEPDRFGGLGSGWGAEPKARPDYKPWKPPAQVQADEVELARNLGQPRRTRFEETETELSRDQQGKKDKRSQRRGGQTSRFERDEDDADLWEERERRRAEKKARKAAKAQEVEEPAAKPIFIPEFINVATLSSAMQQRVAGFLTDLEEMGFENITEDTIMTGDTAALIAMEYGFEPEVDDGAKRDLRPRPPPEDESVLVSRPPVVTIMGHVDHGKTTLLDYLRKSSVAAQEHGGITQHIGAFVVPMSSGKSITFLDTPGHAAFLSMRQRGANVTDIVVLVVAADDSVKPQTIEAIKHATSAKVPIIVAINKVDKEDARIDQVKADLSRHGVEIEDFGGDVQVVCVSGKTGQGMADLEENISTLSEVLDVKAEKGGMAEGWILESSIKQDGRAATVLVKRGTLRLGDIIVAGTTMARIRVLRNEAGVDVVEAPPGTPVEILGWRELPEAGQQILQAPDDSSARTAIEYRQEMKEREESSKQLAEQEQRQREQAAAKEAAEAGDLDGEADGESGEKEAGVITQNFVIRADVAGSVEAVVASVMEQGNNEVRGRVLRSSTGAISESDVDHAAATNSILVNFNSTILPHVKDLANQAKVRIIDHSVIYHLIDDVRGALAELLPPLLTHRTTGEADIAQTFDISIKKRVTRTIAGCKVRNGSIKRNSAVKILRRGKVIYEGKIDTLKHVKKDVAEMAKGSECGIGFEDFQDLRVDDQVQTYEIIEEKRTL